MNNRSRLQRLSKRNDRRRGGKTLFEVSLPVKGTTPAPAAVPSRPEFFNVVDAFQAELGAFVARLDAMIRRTALQFMVEGLRDGSANPSDK